MRIFKLTILSSVFLLPGTGIFAGAAEDLAGKLLSWKYYASDSQKAYFDECNQEFLALDPNVENLETLLDVRIMRSFWAKNLVQTLSLEAEATVSSDSFKDILDRLDRLRGFIDELALKRLVSVQKKIGDDSSNDALQLLLAKHAEQSQAHEALNELGARSDALKLLGPPHIKKFRPMRASTSKRFDPKAWLKDPQYGEYQFIDGDPDRVYYRGLELRSGDIVLTQTTHSGDGVLDGFTEQTAYIPHAMLFVVHRVVGENGQIEYRPSIDEMSAEGIRSLPLSTVTNPGFSAYTEWLRPHHLPENFGEKLSANIGKWKSIDFAFDFLARPPPPHGDFSTRVCATYELSCASFTTLPYADLGLDSDWKYPLMELNPKASENLAKLGYPETRGLFTATSLLLSGFKRVGWIDNGQPEMSIAQALVVGRPEYVETFSGMLSQLPIKRESMNGFKETEAWYDAWKKRFEQWRYWKTQFEITTIQLGQSDSLLGAGARFIAGVKEGHVPKSASPSVIQLYVAYDLEASHMVTNIMCPMIFSMTSQSGEKIPRLSEYRNIPELRKLTKDSMLKSKIVQEGWYDLEK